MVLFGDAHVFQLLEKDADMLIMFQHAGANHILFGATFVDPPFSDTSRSRAHQMRMARGVETSRRRAYRPCRPCRSQFSVCPSNSGSKVSMRLRGQHAGILHLLLAHSAEHRILGRIVLVRCPAMKHAPRPVFFQVGRILLAGIIELFRFLFGIEVIKVSEPFVETVRP